MRTAITQLARALGDHEVIVVDGGSTDRTADVAAEAGATIVPSRVACGSDERGRGSSERTRPSSSSTPTRRSRQVRVTAIRSALAAAGRWRFTVLHDRRPLPFRLAAAAYRPFHRGVYGDQAIFVTREAFERVGGYQSLPIMEDYDLVQRLRRVGRFDRAPDVRHHVGPATARPGRAAHVPPRGVDQAALSPRRVAAPAGRPVRRLS